MAIEKKEKGSGNLLSLLLSIFFLLIICLGIYVFYNFNFSIKNLNDITFGEFSILALASFRLTRLFVYDSVAQFIRDIFLDKKESKEKGIIYVERSKANTGIRRLFADLLSCPWCTGVWVSLATVFVYYLAPWTWFLWMVLAIAGISSFIQISINGIGWRAEHRKLKTIRYQQKI